MDWKIILGKVLTILMALCIFSCEKEEINELCFIGDSNVERWDVQQSFPSFITQNYGKGGTGIGYVASFTGKMKGKKVIVFTGTNDLDNLDDAYSARYVETVKGLDAREVFVIAILPRDASENKNDIIAALNLQISSLVKSRGWRFIDATDDLLDEGQIKREYYSDGFHLSEHGYELLSSKIQKEL